MCGPTIRMRTPLRCPTNSDYTSARCRELAVRFELSRLRSVDYPEPLTKSGF
jgi:hypothetical protein